MILIKTKTILFLILFIAFNLNVWAQSGNCAAKGATEYMKNLYPDIFPNQFLTEYTSPPLINKTLSVSVYIVLDRDSNENVSHSYIESSINGLNKAFEPVGLSFRICSYNTIQNYHYDTFDFSKNEDREMYDMYRTPNTINLYYSIEYEQGTFFGSSFPGDFKSDCIFLKKTAPPQTIIHQFGHLFGLVHTSQANDELVTRALPLANCHKAGDRLCDTEADPFTNYADPTEIVTECKDKSNLKDSNGDFYLPPTDNYMSLYPPPCTVLFTPKQYDIIYYIYKTYKSYLW